MNPRVALAALPLIFAAGAAGSYGLAPHLAIPPRALAQPVLVVTAWGNSGSAAWAYLAAVLALASLAYLGVLRALDAEESERYAGLVVVTTALCLVIAANFRFIFSSDVYAYAAYGALAALGEDPYHRYVPFAMPLPHTAFAADVRFEWPSLPACVYGGTFVALMREIVTAANFHLGTALAATRVLAAAAFVATVALVARAAPRRRAFAAAAIGLNPVALWSIAEGHNDAFALFAVAAGVCLIRTQPVLAGIVAGAAGFIKGTGALGAFGAAYLLRRMSFTTAAVVTLGVAAAVQIAALINAHGFTPGTASGSDRIAVAAYVAKGVLAVCAASLAIVRARQGDRAAALAVTALALWAALPNPYPWYAVWLLPLAVLTWGTTEAGALLTATFCAPLRYLSDASGNGGQAPWLALAAITIPLIFLAAGKPAWRTRLSERTLPT